MTLLALAIAVAVVMVVERCEVEEVKAPLVLAVVGALIWGFHYLTRGL